MTNKKEKENPAVTALKQKMLRKYTHIGQAVLTLFLLIDEAKELNDTIGKLITQPAPQATEEKGE